MGDSSADCQSPVGSGSVRVPQVLTTLPCPGGSRGVGPLKPVSEKAVGLERAGMRGRGEPAGAPIREAGS